MQPSPATPRVTQKQTLFCREYVKDHDSTKAALRAGFNTPMARTIGHHLLKKDSIQQLIEQLQKERDEKMTVNRDNVLRELALIAFSDINDVVKVEEIETTDKDGKTEKIVKIIPKKTELLTEDERKTIAGLVQTEHGFKVFTHNKVSALRLLFRYLGLHSTKPGEDPTVVKPVGAIKLPWGWIPI